MSMDVLEWDKSAKVFYPIASPSVLPKKFRLCKSICLSTSIRVFVLPGFPFCNLFLQ